MSRGCQGGVKVVSKGCQGDIKRVSPGCQGVVKGVSRGGQGDVKGVSRGCPSRGCCYLHGLHEQRRRGRQRGGRKRVRRHQQHRRAELGQHRSQRHCSTQTCHRNTQVWSLHQPIHVDCTTQVRSLHHPSVATASPKCGQCTTQAPPAARRIRTAPPAEARSHPASPPATTQVKRRNLKLRPKLESGSHGCSFKCCIQARSPRGPHGVNLHLKPSIEGGPS